jgi:hypothetical protein
LPLISSSLGDPAGWTEYVVGVLASRVADTGRIVTIAAGNAGSEGAWYASNPATGINVISVTSVEKWVSLFATTPFMLTRFFSCSSASSVQTVLTSTGYGPIQYSSLHPYPLPSPFKYDTFYPIYAVSTDTGIADDACNPLPTSTPNLIDKIIIVRRGGCAYVQKLQNIGAKGGNMSFIYDKCVIE